jgi:hypothetical protein
MRERLPNRRAALTTKIVHNGDDLHATFGTSEDGRLLEVFVDGPRVGSDAYFAVKEAATMASIALQHGSTPEELRAAIPRGVMATILDEWARLREA